MAVVGLLGNENDAETKCFKDDLLQNTGFAFARGTLNVQAFCSSHHLSV